MDPPRRIPAAGADVTADGGHQDPDGAAFHVVVEAMVPEAEDVLTIVLRLRNGEAVPRWSPGAHIDLILPDGTARQYSLHGRPDDWRISILRQPQGRGGSMYLHGAVHQGDVLQVRGPRNNFPLVMAASYLFVAGGIGITPLLPMIRTVHARGAKWRLLYGGRRRESMAFADSLAELGQHVTIHPEDQCGLLDLDAAITHADPGTAIYCCGPEPLIAAMETLCAATPSVTLHVERFAPRPQTEPARSESFEVHLRQSDVTFVVKSDQTILEAAEAHGVSLPSSCREGTCGACETRVVSGTPEHHDSVLTPQEQAAGTTIMPCCSRSRSGRLVLDA